MTERSLIFFAGLLAIFLAVFPAAHAQEIDGSDLRREQQQREERIGKLTTDEQLKVRAAQRSAAKDPEVQAALQKRNEAIREFREALRASMIKADPTVEAILVKLTAEPAPAPTQAGSMSIQQRP